MNPKLHALRVTPAIRRQRATLRALMERFVVHEVSLAAAAGRSSPFDSAVVPFPDAPGKVIPFTLAPQAS
jgi:hypothetical protein